MSNPKYLYDVTSNGTHRAYITATSSTEAKRIFCRERGISPGNYWSGVSIYSAKALKTPEELQAANDYLTACSFCVGMMELYVNAYKDQEAGG